MRAGKDDEARIIRDTRLAIEPTALPKIDAAWVEAHLDRGQQLLWTVKDEAAKVEFALALAKDALIQPKIDAAWAEVHLDRGKIGRAHV